MSQLKDQTLQVLKISLHKTFFPYFSGRANSISQQSTAVTVKSAENLDISPSQQKIPKCVFKKMLVLIEI